MDYNIYAGGGDSEQGHNTISPGGHLDPGQAPYIIPVAEGSDKTFTITADSGYKLTHIGVDNVWFASPPNTYTFYNVSAAHIICARVALLVTEPTVTTNPATSVKKETATLNGTLINANQPLGSEDVPADCGFEYGLDTHYGETTPTELKFDGETFSQAINGLTPNTTYHFRASAYNLSPDSYGYGVDRTFKTKGAVLGNINVDQLIYQHAERMVR